MSLIMKNHTHLIIALSILLALPCHTLINAGTPASTPTKTVATCNAKYNFSIQTVGMQNEEEMTIIPTSNVNFHAPPNSGHQSLHYFWNFGDGHTSTARNPIHTFNYCGTYDVSLTVTDPNGYLQTHTINKSIAIGGLCLNLDKMPKNAQKVKITPNANEQNSDFVAAQEK